MYASGWSSVCQRSATRSSGRLQQVLSVLPVAGQQVGHADQRCPSRRGELLERRSCPIHVHVRGTRRLRLARRAISTQASAMARKSAR